MKDLAKSLPAFIIAILGFIIGIVWSISSGWEWEPILITLVSLVEIITYVILVIVSGDTKPENKPIAKNENVSTTTVNVNVNQAKKIYGEGNIQIRTEAIEKISKNNKIEQQKSKVRILFIDDQKFSRITKVFKNAGWVHTKIVKDVKSTDVLEIKESHILFIDVHGVGKIMELKYEGLDLAYMIKSKYPEKSVIIYSIEKNNNSFHEVWDIIDARVMKNATPFEFQNLVENLSLKY